MRQDGSAPFWGDYKEDSGERKTSLKDGLSSRHVVQSHERQERPICKKLEGENNAK